MKHFHSALKLTEVLKEREAQIELKRLVEQLREEQEREILEKFRVLQARKDLADEQKSLAKQEELARTRQFQVKQWVEAFFILCPCVHGYLLGVE